MCRLVTARAWPAEARIGLYRVDYPLDKLEDRACRRMLLSRTIVPSAAFTIPPLTLP